MLPQTFVLLNISYLSRCHALGLSKLAGELGFEPRSSVLETDSLTVELTPPVLRERDDLRLTLKPAELLRFFVIRVLAAGIAELRELQTASGRLLVLRR
jgi:hypothetical protein